MPTIYVDQNYSGFDSDGSAGKPFLTIQSAIDAIVGGNVTVQISTGTYIEQVQIDGLVNVTLINDGAVTIQAPPDVVVTAIGSPSGSYPAGRSNNAVVTIENSTNVVIEGIIVDGAGAGNTVNVEPGFNAANYIGVLYRNASGGLTEVDITGIRDPYAAGTTIEGNAVMSGVQRGVGLIVDNGGGARLDFFMHGGSISDFQKNGTAFVNAHLDIAGVTINGGGAQTIIAQNGFQVADSTGSISGNTVNGIAFAGSGAVATSILAYQNIDLEITNNEINAPLIDNGGSVGIYLLDFAPGKTVGGTVTGNTVNHADYAIYIASSFNGGTFTLGDNIITDASSAGEVYAPASGSIVSLIQLGTDGADVFDALAGNQSFDGGLGSDTIDVSLADGAYVNLDSGHAFSAATGFDMLSSIENVKGSAGNDTFYGNEHANTFIASQGSDLIDGAEGTDTFDASAATSAMQVNLVAGTATGHFTATLANIENAKTGSGNDTITIVSATDMVDGGTGFDTVVSTAEYGSTTISWDDASGQFIVNGDALENVEKLQLGDKNVWLVHDTAELTHALANAGAGDVIKLADNTYNGAFNVTVDGLTIESANEIASEVVFKGTYSAERGLGSGVDIPTFLKGGGSSAGPTGISIQADGITLKGVTITDYRKGIDLQTNDGLTLDGIVLDNNVHSIYKENGTANVTDFVLKNSDISRAYQGLTINADDNATNGYEGSFDGVTIFNTTFTDLVEKGIYVEQLSNAQIYDIWMTDVGHFGRTATFGPIGQNGAGIDINLKFGAFSTVSIHDFHFDNVGMSNREGLDAVPHLNGGAIHIKARDDGGYGASPATLTNVTVSNGEIAGTTTGIRIGEPGKTTAGPSNVTIENIEITGATVGSFDNQTTTPRTVTLTDGNDVATVNPASTGRFEFLGEGGDDDITGGGFNDTIEGGAGNDTIDGGAGHDIAVFDANYGDATITGTTTEFTVNLGSASTDTLKNVEKAVFTNGSTDPEDHTNVWLVDTTAELTYALANAVDGDVVQLAAGVQYGVGNAVFTVANKAIAILGANADVGVDGVRGAESTIVGHLVVTGSKNVSINGVQFWADATTGTNSHGAAALKLEGSGNHTIENSRFFSNFVGGNQEATAIMLPSNYSGSVTIDNNTITGASLSGFGTAAWQRGIWSDGGSSNLVISNNVFAGVRAALNLDSYDDGKSDVFGNTIPLNAGVVTVGTAISIGIPVSGPVYANIHDNDFSGANGDFNFRNLTTSVSFDYNATGNTTTTGAELLGSGSHDTITGSEGNDIIAGDGLKPTDTMNGRTFDSPGLGNDVLSGLGGNDYIFGQSGNDAIDGGSGNDSLFGGADNDTILGGTGNDSIEGGDGNDSIDGGDDNDVILGGAGTDSILGGAGTDSILGGDGNDTIDGGDGADTIDGGANDDLITGGGGADSIVGGLGNDTIDGGAGNDTIEGGDGSDTVVYDQGINGYTIQYNVGTETFTVTQVGGSQVDTVRGVEFFTFGSQTYAADPGIVVNGSNPVFEDTDASEVVSITENTANPFVFDASATDADNAAVFGDIVYTLEGTDADSFLVDANGIVTFDGTPDREDQSSYSFLVRATQGVTSSIKTFTVNVTDVNDTNPVFSSDASASVTENTSAATVLHTAVASDLDTTGGAIVYSLSGTDAAKFTIGAANGQLKLNAAPDFEAQAEYNIKIVATQGTTVTEQDFVLTVTNIGEPNGLASSSVSQSLESGTTKTAVTNVPGSDNTLTFDVADLELGTGKLYFANGTLVTEGMTGLSKADLDGLTFSSGAAGSAFAQFTVNKEGVDDDTFTFQFDVTSAVNGNINGSSSGTRIDGAGGNDTIKGNGGKDTIFGGAGKDNIDGGSSSDVINGGLGNDTLKGGTGNDKFVFDTALGGNVDRILDFKRGTDKIVLDNDIFTAIGSKLTSSEFRKNTSGNAQDGTDHIIYETDTGKLYYDADGVGGAGKVHFATIDGKPSLSLSDFLIV